ncbi:MAG: type II and III secretion system protein [Calditrichaeota bacterium]|nr:type II and III secretion system protein [Calditrichota bacterium]RQV92990.1 MAG: type II and III secretion system protein [bacterium]RQW03543.1 MAG: type II and III secretion system protein [Calditrichota bacterium]
MNRKICISVFLAILIGSQVLLAQNRRQIKELRNVYKAPEEIVSLSRTMTFQQALDLFNDLSKKYLGKLIVDPEGRNFPIGEDIDKMHWLDAFELILRLHELWYDEFEDYIQIRSMKDATGGDNLTAEQRKYMLEFDNREVILNVVFFETNISKLREAGMSWSIFRDLDVNTTASLTASDNKPSLFQVEASPDLDFADILATFKALESDNLGEIVASPQVTVKSAGKGRIQVGSDVSVTLQDFAGNTVTQFISTGSIMTVEPFIMQRDSIDFIVLRLRVERSSSQTGEVGLEILKTQAETEVLLLDGEETIIGGLYVDESGNSREGVPFLKDLPWWFFGLRYVFGYESHQITRKELLILLKADLLPSLSDRYESRFQRKNDLLRSYNNAMKRRLENYKKQVYK